MSDSVAPWTVARQAPLSMGFSRQESWGGLPFPSPGDLADPGTEPLSPALAGGFFTTEPPGSLGLATKDPCCAPHELSVLISSSPLKETLDSGFPCSGRRHTGPADIGSSVCPWTSAGKWASGGRSHRVCVCESGRQDGQQWAWVPDQCLVSGWF